MAVLEGVTNFFQFLYTRMIYSWNLFSLIIITVIFIALQIGFIYLYARIFKIVFRLYPTLEYWVRRLTV